MTDEMSLEYVAALAEKLSSADRRKLAEKLLRRLAEEQSGHPGLSWKDAAGAGAASYPICGEDAQAWVTRSRQEDDLQPTP